MDEGWVHKPAIVSRQSSVLAPSGSWRQVTIPSLLKLKHLPSVVFVGVDGPGDVLDHTYQELFRAGGFVISDDKILEALTLVQLKEIIKILEKLNGNGNGRWKWLLHYRESKRLKEDERVDSTAHKKNILLKSFQNANIIELLHYHHCDSRSSTKAEVLKCLLNLQIQHINARFAVFLTGDLTTAYLDMDDANKKLLFSFSFGKLVKTHNKLPEETTSSVFRAWPVLFVFPPKVKYTEQINDSFTWPLEKLLSDVIKTRIS
ncbi:hypothetical protein P7K49_015013 [Saguinus oedipus]|uniref:Uncharacterized protein n=1 Tax=Saguinus oedipus TaxID=9490 RepID=A0ABQ9V811_SAGOE|nr:hypothetical protein P7K49_015013 [Saguinus oedipus]